MQNKRIAIWLVVAGALLFNLVFWQEKFAVNTVIFDLFLLASLFYLYPYTHAGQFNIVKWLLPGHFLCLAMVIVHNTLLSKIAFTATLLLLSTFLSYTHRSIWFAGGSVLLDTFLMVANFFEAWQPLRFRRGKSRRISRTIRFLVIPVILVLVFAAIYASANSIFSALTAKVETLFQQLADHFLSLFSWTRFLFMLAGLYLTGMLLLKGRLTWFQYKEQYMKDVLERSRHSRRRTGFGTALWHTIMGRYAKGIMALKNEYTIGLISLVLLNLLLLVVNVIDIRYVWLNEQYAATQNLTQAVHEGAGTLIFSIVLAILVLLIFFKGNLNFYRKNKWLKAGAYAWIIQNTVLVVSVLLRDYYYIDHAGLAYKRIGVLFFLLLVLVGLVTVFIKIASRKTSYYLLRVNAWAALAVLILSSAVDWDLLIADYNISHSDRINPDMPFLLTLSDRTLPLLDQHKELLANYEQGIGDAGSRSRHGGAASLLSQLEAREQAFLDSQQQLSWLSWNYADACVEDYFSERPAPRLSMNQTRWR